MAEVTIQQIEVLVAKIYDGAINEYADILAEIANDIYNSCIKLYYASYSPKVYKRHRRPEGYNLYQANGFEIDEDGVISDFEADPDELWQYGAKRDIRAEVIDAVLHGKRGIKHRPGGWPKKWFASYPNQYSQCHDWSSNYQTMAEIIEDFENNILDATRGLKDELIIKYTKQYIK